MERTGALPALQTSEHPSSQFLEKLRALPRACSAAPVLWTPRAVKPQVAAILRCLLRNATRSVAAPIGDLAAEEAQLLLYFAPQLLLRRPVCSIADQEAESDALPSIATVVRDRVSGARAGSWDALVDEYVAELARSTCTPVQHLATCAEAGTLTPAQAQAAAVKARTGSLRAAASILIGGPSVHPSAETDKAIRELFHTSEADDEEMHQMRAAFAAINSIPELKRAKVTLRHVSAQIAAMRPAAGPGPSGWRNAYLQAILADTDGPATLALWCQAWASGTPSPWIADIWSPALARLFWKIARIAEKSGQSCAPRRSTSCRWP